MSHKDMFIYNRVFPGINTVLKIYGRSLQKDWKETRIYNTLSLTN
jgi:hypothetical protein